MASHAAAFSFAAACATSLPWKRTAFFSFSEGWRSTLDGQTVDTLIVPGALDVASVTRDPELISWVRDRAPGCRRVCSVCVGTFLLAAAGLLEGRRAATHWMHCGLLSARHPNISVEPDTPARAVEAIRVDAAKRALEETDDRMEAIASRCGFRNEEQPTASASQPDAGAGSAIGQR